MTASSGPLSVCHTRTWFQTTAIAANGWAVGPVPPPSAQHETRRPELAGRVLSRYVGKSEMTPGGVAVEPNGFVALGHKLAFRPCHCEPDPVQDERCLALKRSFGARVRQLRRKRGYSQEAFASHCGLHRTYMGDIERGEANLSLCIIDKIARGLRLPMAKLVSRLDDPETDQATTASRG